jgi:hypothetical protein
VKGAAAASSTARVGEMAEKVKVLNKKHTERAGELVFPFSSLIEKIKVGKVVFESPKIVGFGYFAEGDGFLIVIKEREKLYAIASAARVYEVVERAGRLYVEIPYGGGRVYRAPLRFKI